MSRFKALISPFNIFRYFASLRTESSRILGRQGFETCGNRELGFDLADRAKRVMQEEHKFLSDDLPLPSAMLLATETAARRSCAMSPYCSSLGNCRVHS
jgi:hypothetical protein